MASASMPQIFRSPERRSLGHLMSVCNSGSFVQGVSNRQRRHESDQRPMIQRDCGPQKNAEIEARAFRRRPGALQTTPARSLLIRNNREAFLRAFGSQTRQFGVCGRQRLESQDLWLEERHMDDVDYTEPSAVAPGHSMRRIMEADATALSDQKLEIPLVMLSLFAGAAFLTKMCYLSLAFNSLFVIVFLALFYFYVRARLNIHIPVRACWDLCSLALQVDALGNFFRMYGTALWTNAVRRVLTHGRASACQSNYRVACSAGCLTVRLPAAAQADCVLCRNNSVQFVGCLRDH